MRIRLPFAGVFFFLLLLAAWLGLTPAPLSGALASSDKFLHFTTFFLLTLVFYWVLDTTRRRAVHLSLTVCTGALGVGSEFVQSFLPNNRDFDILDIVANVAGSLIALAICSWYHRRMLDRKRSRRRGGAAGSSPVVGDDDEDVELGLTAGQEGGAGDRPGGARTLEEEVDNWDENAVDKWEEDEDGAPSKTGRRDSTGGDLGDAKRAD